jgi:cytochrome c biogenesis protein CcdA
VKAPTAATVSVPHGAGQPIGFGLLGVCLGVALILGKEHLYTLQGGVSEIAGLLPFGYAFGAGMVAAVNPCGVLLLPSLVAYYLANSVASGAAGWLKARNAVILGASATLGFVVLFAIVGSIFAAGGRALGSYFPVGGLAVGVGLTLLGLWLVLTGQTLAVPSASRAMAGAQFNPDFRSMFIFGIGYGVASLACTLPVFLVVAAASLGAGGPLQALGGFVGYALGMGSMLTAVIVGATFFQDAVTLWLKGIVPYLHRMAASLLLGAGIFVIYYWLGPSGLLK